MVIGVHNSALADEYLGHEHLWRYSKSDDHGYGPVDINKVGCT